MSGGGTRVACLQLQARAPGEPIEARVERVCERVAALGDGGQADLVVLPELWPSGYFAFDRYEEAAEPLEGPIVAALADSARAAGAHLVGGSFLERAADGAIHNTAILLAPNGALRATYRKVHVFGYGSREAELLTAGEHPVVAATPAGPVGLSTCYDLRFPELYRAEVTAGAEILAVPAAWPAARREHWRLLLRARALENQAVVIACNGAGDDHGTELAGHSAVIGPGGEVLAEAGAGPEELRVTLPPGLVPDARAEFPALADRRPLGPAVSSAADAGSARSAGSVEQEVLR